MANSGYTRGTLVELPAAVVVTDDVPCGRSGRESLSVNEASTESLFDATPEHKVYDVTGMKRMKSQQF